MDTLRGLGLLGDDGDGQLSGIFSSLVGNIFGGGSSSSKQQTPAPKPGGGAGKISPLTVGLVAGGALLMGAIAVGVFKSRR